MMEREEWLTPREVAAELKLSLRTIQTQLRKGRIPGQKKFGGVWRVLRSELMKPKRREGEG